MGSKRRLGVQLFFLSDRLKSFHQLQMFLSLSTSKSSLLENSFLKAILQNSKSHISLEKSKTGCSLDKIGVSDLLFKDLNQTLLKGAPNNCLKDNHDLEFL